MNIIDLTSFKINITASPFLLLNNFVGRKYRNVKLQSTKLYQSSIALIGLELLLDIKRNLLNNGKIK